MSSIQTEKFFISGPSGQLEAVLDKPASHLKKAVAICCHPHPQHGGTLTNKVIHTVARAQANLGIPAVRFNFRGVQKSEGVYDHGKGEQDDLRAVLAWAQTEYPEHKLWLSGFSFGSWVSAMIAHEYQIEQLISIAPPVARGYFDGMIHPKCDWLAIMGDQDEVVSFSETEKWIESLQPSPQWIVMQGAGHFFHSRLVELREILQEQLQAKAEALPWSL